MPQPPKVPKTAVSAWEFAEQYRAQRQDALFHALVALVLAVAETLAVYLVLSQVYHTPPLESCLGTIRDADLPWFVAVLLSRGLLQPLNLAVFAFAANNLVIRLLVLPKEFRAFNRSYFAGIPTTPEGGPAIGEAVRAVPLANVQQIARDYSGPLPLLVHRIEIGSRRLAQGGDAAEIHAVMQAQSDIDREALESRFTLVRYLTWLIPTIGFLGTVIGIGVAITQFSGVMAQFGGAEDFQARLQGILGQVASNLGVAFDTTMLALLLSAVLVALTSVVQTREEGLLFSIDEFCLRHFVSQISVPDSGARLMEQVVMGLASLAEGVENLAKRGDREDGMTLRDIAGLIQGQTSQIKQAVAEAGDKDSRAAVLPAAQRLAETMTQAADKIQKALQHLQKPLAGVRPGPAQPPPGQTGCT